MGRFSGGTASRWKSRSEINVRTLAAATVATTNSPCHRDRDNFGTISEIDITRSEARQANPPYNRKADDGLERL